MNKLAGICRALRKESLPDMPHKILIVEDNALNRVLLLAVLKPEGY